MRSNISEAAWKPQWPVHLAEFVTLQVIAFLALAGNLLVCILFVRKRNLLKKAYNIYFLILAIIDILIAITMAMTYVIVLSDVTPRSLSSGRVGEFVCRILWSRWLLYFLVVFSVYICLLLTMERWYAVAKPLNYQATSSKKKLWISLLVATVFALIFTCSYPLEVQYSPGQKQPSCSWKPISNTSRGLWAVVQFIGQLLAPALVMMGLFCHITRKTQTNVAPMYDITERRPSNTMTSRTTHNTQRTVTKMIATACMCLILCWGPSQVFYLLSKFDLLSLDSAVHHYLEALTFLNSCLNPAIYGITSQTFRKGYWEVLLGLCPVAMRVRLAQSREGLGESLGSVVFLVHTLHRRRSYDWRFDGIRGSMAVPIENNTPSNEVTVGQSSSDK